MAVEVLDYQGFSKLREKGDVDEAMMMHLQSMQNLVTLLAKPQDRTLMATSDTAISDFKKLVTLLGGSGHPRGGSGHARFRHGPATPVVRVSSHVTEKVRSSPVLCDAVQTECDMDARPASSCSLSNHMDACMLNTSVQDSSLVNIHIRRGHVPQPSLCCSPSGSVRMSEASQMLSNTSTEKLNSHMPPVNNEWCYPCNEGSGDRKHNGFYVSGHARCRDSTVQKLFHQESALSAVAFPQAHESRPCQLQHELHQAAVAAKTNSSLLSSVSMDGGTGTVSTGKPVISSGRPPLPPKKRKVLEKDEDCATKCLNSISCHCEKRRKLKTIRVKRVSTMGLNDGEIPADGYSWCIYRKKMSEESSQPRVYYKCSNLRGCPARKHVQQASDDANMLIVTYGREHSHPHR